MAVVARPLNELGDALPRVLVFAPACSTLDPLGSVAGAELQQKCDERPRLDRRAGAGGREQGGQLRWLAVDVVEGRQLRLALRVGTVVHRQAEP